MLVNENDKHINHTHIHTHTHTHTQLEEQREWSSNQKPDSADSEGEEDEPAIDKLTIYRQIMEILHPGETLPKVYINHRVSPGRGEEGRGGEGREGRGEGGGGEGGGANGNNFIC